MGDLKYGAITTRTIYIPGDERSRTNPGHGYPETTETAISLNEFPTEEALVAFIQSRTGYAGATPIRAIRFEDLTISRTVTVSVKP